METDDNTTGVFRSVIEIFKTEVAAAWDLSSVLQLYERGVDVENVFLCSAYSDSLRLYFETDPNGLPIL